MDKRTGGEARSTGSPDFPEALGRTIKVIRTDLGIERRDLAERAGISYSYLTEIENGNRPPSPTRLGHIAEALGLRLSQLIEAAETRVETQSAGTPTPLAYTEQSFFGREPSRTPDAPTQAYYSMQPSLRGSDRRLRSPVLELERLMRTMDPDDIERLLDFAHRLARS